MKPSYVLRDTRQIKRMKKHSLFWYYGCSGEIYKLLSLKILHKLVKKIERGKIQLKSKLLYGRDYITYEENFISILDKYIGYIRDTYTIKHNELIMVIEESLKNVHSDCLFVKVDFHDNYEIFGNKFKQLFLANIVYNIRFYAKYGEEYESIQKANLFLKDKKLNEIKDLIKIEKFFIEVINNRKDNLFNCFVPHSEVKSKDYDYYMHQLDWVLKDYYKKTESIFNE